MILTLAVLMDVWSFVSVFCCLERVSDDACDKSVV